MLYGVFTFFQIYRISCQKKFKYIELLTGGNCIFERYCNFFLGWPKLFYCIFACWIWKFHVKWYHLHVLEKRDNWKDKYMHDKALSGEEVIYHNFDSVKDEYRARVPELVDSQRATFACA